MPRSMARGRERRECVLGGEENVRCAGKEKHKVCARKRHKQGSAGREEKEKEKTDEGSSVFLYLVTKEGE